MVLGRSTEYFSLSGLNVSQVSYRGVTVPEQFLRPSYRPVARVQVGVFARGCPLRCIQCGFILFGILTAEANSLDRPAAFFFFRGFTSKESRDSIRPIEQRCQEVHLGQQVAIGRSDSILGVTFSSGKIRPACPPKTCVNTTYRKIRCYCRNTVVLWNAVCWPECYCTQVLAYIFSQDPDLT